MASQPLESELLRLLGDDNKARIVARYHGLDGLGGTTLHDAGREFGLSAERVRQIVKEAATQLSDSQPFTPVLDRTISFLCQFIPGRANEMECKVLSEGLSDVPVPARRLNPGS